MLFHKLYQRLQNVLVGPEWHLVFLAYHEEGTEKFSLTIRGWNAIVACEKARKYMRGIGWESIRVLEIKETSI